MVAHERPCPSGASSRDPGPSDRGLGLHRPASPGSARRRPGLRSTAPPARRLRRGCRASGIRSSLADPEAVDRLVAEVRPEIVFHLASHVAGSRDVSLVLPTFLGNLASTVCLMTALVRHGGCSRFVQAGSLEEPEEAEAVPASPYAAAKAGAAGYSRMFHSLYGLPVVVARLFMVYGPGRQDLRSWCPTPSRRCCAARRPSFSSGVRPVDWVYVEDVAEGLLAPGHRAGRRRPAGRPRTGRAAHRPPGGRGDLPPGGAREDPFVRRPGRPFRRAGAHARATPRPSPCWAGRRRFRSPRGWRAPSPGFATPARR